MFVLQGYVASAGYWTDIRHLRTIGMLLLKRRQHAGNPKFRIRMEAIMIIRDKRVNPFHEVYSSDDVEQPHIALKQWLNRRKVGRRAFTREQELECATQLGGALSRSLREVNMLGDLVEVIV